MLPIDRIPQRYRESAARMAAAIAGLDRTIVSGHINLDGDALGSMAAAGHILRALGKEYVLYSATKLPSYLDFFPLPAVLHTSLERLPFTPASILMLDCGEASRLGEALAARVPTLSVLNIDHHLGNTVDSLHHWIEPEAAATAQLMAYTALAAGLPLTGDLATSITLGIVTDTGGFCHGNTSADVLSLAAHLVSEGCNLAALRSRLENNWSLGRMRLWSRLMERARLDRNGSLAFCSVLLEDLRQCNALKEDLEGFVEQLRRLRGVTAAALLREDAPGVCKFSLRSAGLTDIRSAAATLGGGGHRNAAGGTLKLTPDKAERVLLAALTTQLDYEDTQNNGS